MSPAFYFRQAVRESRGARRLLVLFALCLGIGVAAVTAVSSVTASIEQAIRLQARELLGADLSISGRRRVPDLTPILTDMGLADQVRQTAVWEMATVIGGPPGQTPARSALVELRVIDGHYPFYGSIELDPPAAQLYDLLNPDQLVVAPALLERLEIEIGDTVRMGGQTFQVAAAVLDEPGELDFSFSLGPRVYVSKAGLDRTALAGRGSRMRHTRLLALPGEVSEARAAAVAGELTERLENPAYYRVETFSEAQPSLRRGLDRLGHFLGLVGLLTLLIGAVGVAQTVRGWIATRTEPIAVRKCLGMRPGEVVMLYVVQAMLLALLGSALGACLGAAMPALLVTWFPELLPPDLVSPWQPLAVLRGVALGVGVAMLFCLPPLVDLQRIPPARVFRSDSEPLRLSRWVKLAMLLAISAGLLLAARVQGGQWDRALYFSAGLALTVAVLAGVGGAIIALAGRAPARLGTRGRGKLRLRLRHGLAGLARPGAATVSSLVALGLGVALVLAVRLVEIQLRHDLASELPESAPSTFFIDIQPDQWPEVEAAIRVAGGQSIDSVPVITARFTHIGGVPVEQLLAERQAARERGERSRSRWVLTREQRLTYRPALPRGNTIVAGKLWSLPDHPEVSIEEEFAEDLGVTPGSTVTLDVQGVPLELWVTTIRHVNWRTFGINFFLMVEPGVMDDAPQLRVATARLPAGAEYTLQSQFVERFPNVTMIHIREMLAKVLAMIDRLLLAIQVLGGLTVAAGAVILMGAITASYARRSREVALLKTLGMTRGDVTGVFAVEYTVLGVVAACLGAMAANALAWAVVAWILELPFALHWGENLVAMAIAVVVTVAMGLAASTRALTIRPGAILRGL